MLIAEESENPGAYSGVSRFDRDLSTILMKKLLQEGTTRRALSKSRGAIRSSMPPVYTPIHIGGLKPTRQRRMAWGTPLAFDARLVLKSTGGGISVS